MATPVTAAMLWIWTLAALLANHAAAQTTSSSQTTTQGAISPSPPPMSTSPWPAASLFVPISFPDHLGASIVTVNSDQTVFAVDCLNQAPGTGCHIHTAITITGGESTWVCTNTYEDAEGSSGSPTTINCDLSGGYPATAVTCTGRSAISGLGDEAATTTLSSSDISYTLVAITAGGEKLSKMPQHTRTSPDKNKDGTGSGNVAVITTAPQLVLGGVAAAVGLIVG